MPWSCSGLQPQTEEKTALRADATGQRMELGARQDVRKAVATKEAGSAYQVGLIRSLASDGMQTPNQSLLILIRTNPQRAWGNCFTQCFLTKYFRGKVFSSLHLPADGARGDEALKSKFGDTSCSILYPSVFIFGENVPYIVPLCNGTPFMYQAPLHLTIFEDSLSRI